MRDNEEVNAKKYLITMVFFLVIIILCRAGWLIADRLIDFAFGMNFETCKEYFE